MSTKLTGLLFCLLQLGFIAAQETYTICRYMPSVNYFENNLPKGAIPPNFIVTPKNDIEISANAYAFVKQTGKENVKFLGGGKRYSFLDIKNIFEAKKSLLESFLSFLGLEVKKTDESLYKYAEQNMKDVKAGPARDAADRRLLPPFGASLLQNKVHFKLNEKITGSATYRLLVYRANNKTPEIDTTISRETIQNIPKQTAANDDTLYWKCLKVNEELESKQPFHFVFVNEASVKKIKQEERRLLMNNYASEDEKLLALAFFYQERNLFYEADAAYKELITKFSSQDYKDLYTLFLAEWFVF